MLLVGGVEQMQRIATRTRHHCRMISRLAERVAMIAGTRGLDVGTTIIVFRRGGLARCN